MSQTYKVGWTLSADTARVVQQRLTQRNLTTGVSIEFNLEATDNEKLFELEVNNTYRFECVALGQFDPSLPVVASDPLVSADISVVADGANWKPAPPTDFVIARVA